MLFAPLEGWRRVEVTDRRTKVDWARVVRKLVDEDYPDKDRIVLVMDNLNTHHPASLYDAFEPAEARRIAERREIHYTPKPSATRSSRVAGSWLNMAEIEIGVAGPPMLGPPHSRPRCATKRVKGVARPAQPRHHKSGLALHHRGRTHQIEVPVSINPKLMDY